jgi:hypothetical protein
MAMGSGRSSRLYSSEVAGSEMEGGGCQGAAVIHARPVSLQTMFTRWGIISPPHFGGSSERRFWQFSAATWASVCSCRFSGAVDRINQKQRASHGIMGDADEHRPSHFRTAMA